MHDEALSKLNKRDASGKVLVTKDDPVLQPNYGKTGMMIIAVFNIITTLINCYIVGYKTKYASESYWNNYTAYLDTLFCIINIFIICLVIYYKPTHFLRYLEAFGTILLLQKSLYFLEMNQKIAPLILIFYEVFIDIIYFSVVILIMFCAFATSFYLMGQN